MALLSQDNGDGEHASVAIENAMRDAMNGQSPSLGDVGVWGLGGWSGTDDNTEDQTVWTFVANGTTFRLALTKLDTE